MKIKLNSTQVVVEVEVRVELGNMVKYAVMENCVSAVSMLAEEI